MERRQQKKKGQREKEKRQRIERDRSKKEGQEKQPEIEELLLDVVVDVVEAADHVWGSERLHSRIS